MSQNKDFVAGKKTRHRPKVPLLSGVGEELLGQILGLLSPTEEALVRLHGLGQWPMRFWVGHLPIEEATAGQKVRLRCAVFRQERTKREDARDAAVAAVFVLTGDADSWGIWWPPNEVLLLTRIGIPFVALKGDEHRVLRRAWFNHERVAHRG